MTNTSTKQVYLTQQEFDIDLETCLLIIQEPSKSKPYYVCEYTSHSLHKSIVHIYIK